MVRLRRRWLQQGETVCWRAMANHGRWNTRQVGGHLFVTDRRLVFRPIWIELVTDEMPWEAPLSEIALSVGPGQWAPRLRVLERFALRYNIQVLGADGSEEHFFVTHLGPQIVELARGNVPDLRPASAYRSKW